MVNLVLVLIGLVAMAVTWPLWLVLYGSLTAFTAVREAKEGYNPSTILYWERRKNEEFPPLFFSSLFILSGIFGFLLLWEGHYGWYMTVSVVIYITMVFSLGEILTFSRRVNSTARKIGKGIFYLLRRFCQNLAEGDGFWWILGLILWPLKTAWLAWPCENRILIVFYTVVFFFLFGGYLEGYMPYQVLYLLLMIIWGILFLLAEE